MAAACDGRPCVASSPFRESSRGLAQDQTLPPDAAQAGIGTGSGCLFSPPPADATPSSQEQLAALVSLRAFLETPANGTNLNPVNLLDKAGVLEALCAFLGGAWPGPPRVARVDLSADADSADSLAEAQRCEGVAARRRLFLHVFAGLPASSLQKLPVPKAEEKRPPLPTRPPNSSPRLIRASTPPSPGAKQRPGSNRPPALELLLTRLLAFVEDHLRLSASPMTVRAADPATRRAQQVGWALLLVYNTHPAAEMVPESHSPDRKAP
jgi:hypothetical protein